MKQFKYIAVLMLGGLSCVASAAQYDAPGRESSQREHRSPPHGPSVERVAMHRLLAQELAQRSGRPVAEITSMLKDAPPPEVAEELGLEREAMHEMFSAARRTLIQRMQAAQLISAEEAAQLQSEQPRRPRHSGGQSGQGERRERRDYPELPQPPEESVR